MGQLRIQQFDKSFCKKFQIVVQRCWYKDPQLSELPIRGTDFNRFHLKNELHDRNNFKDKSSKTDINDFKTYDEFIFKKRQDKTILY